MGGVVTPEMETDGGGRHWWFVHGVARTGKKEKKGEKGNNKVLGKHFFYNILMILELSLV